MRFLFRTVLSFQLRILITILFFGCESKPVQIDLGESGHQLMVVSIDSSQFQSIQLPNRIGTSSKLYLGQLPSGPKSSIIIKLNADVFSQHESLCSENFDSLSFSFMIKYIDENEVGAIPLENIEDSILTVGSFFDNTDNSIIESPIKAYLSFQSDMEFNWDETSKIDFDTTMNCIVVNDNLIPIESLKTVELPVSLLISGIRFSLDSLSVDNPDYHGIIDKLCTDNDDESIWIYLENENDSFNVFGSANNTNPSNLPYLSTTYNEETVESVNIKKFDIKSITANDSINLYLSIQDDINFEEFGTIIGLPFNIINYEPIDTTNPEFYTTLINATDTTQIDFATLLLSPTIHEDDSSHTIEFSINNPIFVFRNFDPSGDNYEGIEDTIGTENNGYYDNGELYKDCGLDFTCNEQEYGFNDLGTENNNQYDIGEIFFDCGIDSLCNNNTFLSQEECDSIGYNWIDNEGCIVQIENDENDMEDDYIIDPVGDDWGDCGTDGLCPNDDGYIIPDNNDTESNGEWDGPEEEVDENYPDAVFDPDFNKWFIDTNMNGKWDLGEGKENNNQCDEGEPFLDYGINAIPDSLEGDFYYLDNVEYGGTENNGIWDEGEWYIDAGLDTVWSSSEEGYNGEGTENNNIYDYGEIYFDFGIDRVQNIYETDYDESLNPDPEMDNLNLDPIGDDWRDCGIDTLCIGDEGYVEADEGENNGSFDTGERWEGNGILNFEDLDGDSVLGIDDISEAWNDWGIDQTPDSAENYYGSYPLLIDLGTNIYIWDETILQDTTFVQPELEGAEDVALWISKIHTIQDENQIELTLSLYSLSEISAFQFQIDHVAYYYQDTIMTYGTEDIYYINSLRLIEDISIYPQNSELLNYDLSPIVNYGQSIITLLDFPDLEMFVAENPDIIISDAIITVHSDTTSTIISENFRLYLKRLLEPFNDEDDSLSADFILDYPYYRIYNNPPDSIQFSVKRYLQKLINNEYNYNKFVISTDGTGNNFESYFFKNDSSVITKLEILYTR